MSGVSQMSKLVKVLASSYVFLNGFGHFNFFWKQNHPNQKQETPSLTNSSAETSAMLRFRMVCYFYFIRNREI
jgi:hypothetical protein